MELSVLLTISLATTGVVVLIILFLIPKKASNTRPPGPKGIPILGNLLQLGDLYHQTMHNWRKDYGPVIWLNIGSINTMVVQSAAAATELFKKHDLQFAGRTANDVLTVLDFLMGLHDVGGNWRMEMLVNRRVNETEEVRHRMRNSLVRWLVEASDAEGAVRVGHYLFLMAFNIAGNLMFSKDLFNPKSPDALRFFESMATVTQLSGRANISDSLPWLKWIDAAGLRRKMEKNMRVALSIVNKFIQERIEERKGRKVERREKKYYLDVLLDYRGNPGKDEPCTITLKNINTHITVSIKEIFFAGSETTSVAVEWGFAELLRTFNKLRQELDRVVGLNRQVQERDMENLHYLQAVVKETLRLHPVLPLLLPRKAREDINFLGYTIPKGTQVFVNVWAIARDPESWEDPLAFKPERFLDSTVHYKGHHFNLLPFGAGRRICPGRRIPLVIGTLVHSFDWDLGPGVKPQDIDLKGRPGLTTHKQNPLYLFPKKRS